MDNALKASACFDPLTASGTGRFLQTVKAQVKPVLEFRTYIRVRRVHP